jgi:hypothetical protein
VELGETLYVKDTARWRAWLENHDKRSAIWLVSYKKASGKPSIPYNDAVEEALDRGHGDAHFAPPGAWAGYAGSISR